MSFRLRALALVLLVAVTATGATAWLTLRQASQQVRQSVQAGQQLTTEIAADLREYGMNHATWSGVATRVSELTQRTGQRIRMVTDAGILVADSDVLAGRSPRQVVGVPVLVDPRPTLTLPTSGTPTALARLTIGAIKQYRDGASYAACLTRAGIGVTATPGADGIPAFTVAGDSTAAQACASQHVDADIQADGVAAMACAQKPDEGVRLCLSQVFVQRVNGAAPEMLQVYLGAVGEAAPSLRVGPAVWVALVVVTAAMLGALLLTRGVLRPVRALTGAARRLGTGDLSQRVPISGRDEIAHLGRSFNWMADSLQASEERQRRLTSDIAHELRTPLSNLRGYLEALRDGVLAPSPQLLASLHEEVLLQQRIVSDLEELALAEAGSLTYHRVDVDLAGLLTTCASAHAGRAEAADLRLSLDVRADVWVHADPDRLRQVVGNLIANAIRATPPAGTVTLRLYRERDLAVIEVRDTGIGVAPEDVPHLFDRFWRADAARGRNTGGSGLGLAIARQIVTDHNGTIDVASTVGTGTVFSIQLTTDRQAASG